MNIQKVLPITDDPPKACITDEHRGVYSVADKSTYRAHVGNLDRVAEAKRENKNILLYS